MLAYHGKKLLLRQVFSNLLNNAVKHHDRDSGIVRVDWEDQEQYYLFQSQTTAQESQLPSKSGYLQYSKP